MKGRTGTALLADIEQWHRMLYQAKATTGADYKPSGFKSYSEEVASNQGPILWSVREILSGKDLAEEGRKLRHCVYSYSLSIQKGQISIWSMSKEEFGQNQRCLTIEVSNRDRRVAQARGIFNRESLSEEFRIMNAWARSNGLSLSSYL